MLSNVWLVNDECCLPALSMTMQRLICGIGEVLSRTISVAKSVAVIAHKA